MEQDKVLKVSDWSQKYKLVIYAISGVGIIVVGFMLVHRLDRMIDLLKIISSK